MIVPLDHLQLYRVGCVCFTTNFRGAAIKRRNAHRIWPALDDSRGTYMSGSDAKLLSEHCIRLLIRSLNHLNLMLFLEFVFVVTMLLSSSQSLQIVPGATWTATNTGLHIQAHGAGFFEEAGVYYMIGEDKTGGTFFQNINAYSSRNLVEWKFEASLLSQADTGDLGPHRIVERPKIIHNDLTSTYVMYMHIDSADYSDARVGVATCNSATGKYTYRGSFRPLGCESRDIGLFKDNDGSAYLFTEDVSLIVSKLK